MRENFKNMSESFSTLNESKRVQTLCRLSPSSIASVKCLKLNSGRYVTVFSTGNSLLHIMLNHKIDCIINVGSCVLRVLDYVDERDEIWLVTKDGKLWAVTIPLHQANEQVKQQTDHEIFEELLVDNNQDISSSSGDHTHNVELFANVHKCSDDCIIYWEPGLQDVAIGTHHVITCSSNDDNVRLTVYPWAEQNNAGKREIAPNFLYQTSLPRDACKHSNNDVTTLLYVSPSEQPSSKCANSTLNKQLFSLLFTSQPGCSIPVVLVGLQSGFVGYVHVGMKSSNVETLYHLEQPILSIFPVCLKPPLPKGISPGSSLTGDALAILGTLGKLVIITQDNSKGLPDSILIREYHVPGPIVCRAMNNNLTTLFYSTLKEVYAVNLKLELGTGKSGDKNATSSPLPFSLSPTALNIPRVLALSIDEANSMICLKTDGRVLLVAKPLGKGILQSSPPSGDQIKKHLGEIQEKAGQVKKLCDEIHQLDDVIKQLNNVTQVLCEILRNHESKNDESTFQETGISFKVGVDYEAQGTSLNPRVILRCDLRNSTKFPFSSNWSLVVQVGTTQPWFNEECSVQATTNHSVSLSPASLHHISIPLEDSLSYLIPIQVSCYVCFGLKELLPAFLKDAEQSLAEEGFSVLVSRTELDVLNFLRKQQTSPVTRQRRYPTHLLQNTLRSLNTTWQPNEVSELVQEQTSGFSKFSVHLSKEAIDYIEKRVLDFNTNETKTESSIKLTSKPNQGESKELKDNLISQEACLLHFILHGSRRHLYSNDMKYPDGHMVVRTPSEEVVKFQVVKLGQVGSTQGMEGLELCVHTSSQELGCSVHSALLKVLKPVLQRTSEESASVPVGELQKQLIKLKELQASLDLLRPSFWSEQSMEENNSHDGTIQKLISIYFDLRKMSTIIS